MKEPLAMAKSQRLPRGCFWPALIMGLLLLVLGILSFAAIGKIWRRSSEVWTEVQGVVDEPYLDRYDSTRRVSRRHTDTTTYWSAKIKYHYVVNDAFYTGDEELTEEPKSNLDVAEVRSILDKHPADSTIAVYYNPTTPDRSRLTPMEPKREFYLDIMFSSIYLLLGIGLLAATRWTRATRDAKSKLVGKD
jgi:Protein of unknown function (DUF3592)